MSSVLELSEEECEKVAQLFFIHNGNPKKISAAMNLGFELTTADLHSYRIRKYIVQENNRSLTLVTREEHLRKLAEIRDAALNAEKPNHRAALAAEIARGQVSGLYNTTLQAEEVDGGKIEDQSTDSIKKQLAKRGIDPQQLPLAEYEEVKEESGDGDF